MNYRARAHRRGQEADLGGRPARDRDAPALPPVALAMVDPGIFKAYDVRGLYPDQIDEDVAYRLGRAFARVLAELEGKPPSELRVGLGRDMRLSAPELSERYADGTARRGRRRARRRDGRHARCSTSPSARAASTAGSCAPRRTTPRPTPAPSWSASGAVALSGDAGIGELRELVQAGEPGPPAERAGDRREEDVGDEFRAAALRFIDPGPVTPMKVVLDGGNGMAGPMVGPLLERLPIERVETYWEPDGEFPDHEPNPLLPENRTLRRREGAGRGRRARHRLGRRRRPLLLHRRHRRVRGRRLPDRAAGRVDPREGARCVDPLRRARVPRGARRGRAGGRQRAREPRRARVLQDPDARGGRRLRRRGVGPLLLPRLLLRGLGHDPRPADPRAARPSAASG